MRTLFIGNNFPPEVNALARRLYEHARQWATDGEEVVVITDVPNFPEGEVYEGYENRYSEETVDGIQVVRVPMWISKNEGAVKRIASFISFMLSAIWFSRRVKGRFDVVAASSPQFFSGLAGYFVSRMKRAPFVLEIRDLWPESIVAVGAMSRNWIIRLLEHVELFLYRHSDHIVVVTNSFKRYMVEKGIDPAKISVIKNGADLEAYGEPIDEQIIEQIKEEHDLHGKFIVSYIGTIGMAHRADILLEAARQCSIEDVVFVVVGTGAERKKLEDRLQAEPQANFRLIDKQPKDKVRYWLALSNASVVHLKDTPLFKTVIPSKIFEAMAMRIPILMSPRCSYRSSVASRMPRTSPVSSAERVVEIVRRPERALSGTSPAWWSRTTRSTSRGACQGRAPLCRIVGTVRIARLAASTSIRPARTILCRTVRRRASARSKWRSGSVVLGARGTPAKSEASAKESARAGLPK